MTSKKIRCRDCVWNLMGNVRLNLTCISFVDIMLLKYGVGM